jgi:hypothetical protein
MAGTKKATGQVNIELNARFDAFQKSLDKTANAVINTEKRISGAFDKIGKVATAALAIGGVYAIKQFSDAITGLADKGDKADALSEAFTRLGGSASEIEKAQDALLGTVSKMELMKSANQGLIKEIPAFNENFAQIAILGNKVGDALGIEATQGIDKVVNALATAKTKQLESIGITINAEQAYRDFASQINVAASSLSEYQKTEARQIAAIKELGDAQKRFGDIADSVTDAYGAVNVSLDEGVVKAGQAINSNEALIQAYRKLQETLNTIDWEALGNSAAVFFSNLLNLANATLPHIVNLINDVSRGFNYLFGDNALASADRLSNSIIPKLTDEIEQLDKQIKSAGMVELGWHKDDWVNRKKQLEEELAKAEAQFAKLKNEVEKSDEAIKKSAEGYTDLNGILIPTIKNTGLSIKGQEDQAKALAKVNAELDKHKQKWVEYLQGQQEADLQYQIKNSIDNLNFQDFDNLVRQFEESVKKGFIEKWQDAIDSKAISLEEVTKNAENAAVAASQAYKDSMNNAILESAQKMKDEYSQAFDEVGATLSQIGDAFGLNIGNAMQSLSRNLSKEQKSQVMGELGSVFGMSGKEMDQSMQALNTNIQALTSASEKDKATRSNAGTGSAAGAGLGTAIGAYFGGPQGAAIGSAIGQTAGEIIGGFIGRGSQNPETIARKEFINFIEDTLKPLGQVSFYDQQGKLKNVSGQNFDFLDTSASRFNLPDWGASMKDWGKGAEAAFIGLGQAMEETLGLTEDVGGQIGFLLGEQLGGNIDNARLLVQQLGLSLADLEEALIETGRTGEASWLEVEIGLQGVNDAFGEGKKAIADIGGAWDDLLNSGGRGVAALKAVRDIAVEGIEAGATNLQDLESKMLALGADPAKVDAFFNALEQRGIKTLESLKNANDRLAGGVVADIASGSEELRKQWDQMGKDLKTLQETIENIPTEKDIEINVKTNFDDNTSTLLNSDALMNQQLASQQAYAPSESVTKTSARGLDIKPAGGNYYQIDARGADIGVENRIIRALKEVEDRAVRRSINAISEGMRRGSRI